MGQFGKNHLGDLNKYLPTDEIGGAVGVSAGLIIEMVIAQFAAGV